MKQFLSIFFVFFTVGAFAQNSFQLSGTVTDQISGEALIGATVIIKNTPFGTTTDENGRFVFEGIKRDLLDLHLSYIGYDAYDEKISLTGKKSLDIIIQLAPSSTELQAVEVKGQAIGALRGLLQQKVAENIKNVLSSEQMETFPDLNAAEAMQRIPGVTLQRDQGEGRFVQLRGTPPELTNFNVNGEQIPSPEGSVRYVGLDIIAVDQIDLIEVTKVMTPDMDADGIGGSVNIITKKATSEKPEVRATLAAGYNNLRERENYQMQFSYGQRTGKLGFTINGSFYENNQGADNLEFKYAKGPFFGSQDAGVDNYFVQYREFQLRHYDITRQRVGISPTLDYYFNDNSRMYIQAMYNHFSDDETRRRVIYDLDDALSLTYYLYGGLEHDVRDRTKLQDLITVNIGGEHTLWGATIDYQLAISNASEREPDRLEVLFDSPGQAIPIDVDLSDKDYPRASFPTETGQENARAWSEYEMDDLLFEESETTDKNLTPRVNVKIPYNWGATGNGYVKFGGKLRLKEKERDITAQAYNAYFQTSRVYPGEGPPLNLETVDGGFSEFNLLNEGFALEKIPDPDLMRDFFEFNSQFFIINRTASKVQTFGEDYSADEKIYAAYAMFRHDWNRLMVLGGVRFEQTDIDYTGRLVNTLRGHFSSLDTLSDSRTHSFLLPQIQLKYTLQNNFNLRAALTYTYSRPNFEDVLPYRAQDLDEVTFGNPNLEYPLSTNVDFLAEKYTRTGLFSGGLFYKKIDDFIFYYKRFAHEGDPQNYGLVEITQAVNGIKASVYGAELQAQFKMDFLPGFLRDFGWYTNYTYTYSEAFINKRISANYTDAVVIFGEDDPSLSLPGQEQEKITLPGQAEHTINMALFYDADRFYARLSANYQDAFLFELGGDPDLDEYYDEALRLDFTANYSLTENIKVFTDLINITNTPQKYYLGSPDYLKQQEFYSWWGRVGVKLSF